MTRPGERARYQELLAELQRRSFANELLVVARQRDFEPILYRLPVAGHESGQHGVHLVDLPILTDAPRLLHLRMVACVGDDWGWVRLRRNCRSGRAPERTVGGPRGLSHHCL
jgi:hypothetical protein